MLYSLWTSRRGSPAAVNRKELCLFHFFERLPEVSSQYSHTGKARTRCPDEEERMATPDAETGQYGLAFSVLGGVVL